MVVEAAREFLNIVGAVQNYDWGLKGSASLVAELGATNSSIPIDESKPYAEVKIFPALIIKDV